MIERPGYVVRDATYRDLVSVANNMREQDKHEVHASFHRSPLQALERSALVSRDTFVAYFEDKPLGVFGITPYAFLCNRASPWLLTTHHMAEHALVFMRASRTVVDLWKNEFEILENFIDARYTQALRWAGWLGFTIHDAKPYGLGGKPFHRIEIRSI